MKKSEMEIAIEMMVDDVNWYSFNAERAKKRNLPMIEQDYFSRILGMDMALSHLGYILKADGIKADCGKGIEHIEYMHYKAIKG